MEIEIARCKGFYVDTVGRNKKVIENYIRNQLQEGYRCRPNLNGRIFRSFHWREKIEKKGKSNP